MKPSFFTSFKFLSFLCALGIFSFQYSYAWSVDVEAHDAPIGHKKVYGMLKNENFDIPDLGEFKCTALKNKMAKNLNDVHYRHLVCSSKTNPVMQFGITTVCAPTAPRNNFLQITTKKNNKLVGYTVSLNCD